MAGWDSVARTIDGCISGWVIGRQRQVVDGGMGFCSQNDRRLHFGLGDQRLGQVTIRWPSGTQQILSGLAIDQLHVITEPQ